jgi:hypothetical protein
MQVRRITINGRDFVLVDPDAAATMLQEIEAGARTGAAWVTIPVRETNPPKVLITSRVVCFLEVLEVPDEDPEVEGAARAFAFDWPELAD